MKRIFFIVALLLFVLASVLVATSMKAGTPAHGAGSPSTPQEGATVDGRKQPDKIPDHVAYAMLFRLIAKRNTEVEKNRVRAYVTMVLGCSTCNNPSAKDRSKKSEEADIDTLIAAATEFDQQVSQLDAQATSIQDSYHPSHHPLSPEDGDQLKALKKRKRAIVNSIMASLPRRLSSEGWVGLQRHIKEHMKRNMTWRSIEEGEETDSH
jgi:hypothetical protein